MANILKETVRGLEKVSIEDEMLKNREIFLVGEVNAESSNELIKKLMYLEQEDRDSAVNLYINSPGGEVVSGLAVYDYIRLMEAPVDTVCIGTAASMGAILFLAGRERKMLRHTRLMIHDPSYGGGELKGKKPHEIRQELDNLNRVKRTLVGIISERTGKSIKEINRVTAKDTYYSAEEAVRFGLATKVVTDGRELA